MAQRGSSPSPSTESKGDEEQEQVIIARVLASLHPAESRSSTQNDCQHVEQRYIPICSKSTLPTSSLLPLQFHSWAYPSYPPELAMYQLWQQEQLLQAHLFQLPFSLSTRSAPQIFPFMQSVIHPDHCLYFPKMDQESTSTRPRITIATSAPSLYLSDHLVPDPIRGRSTVTIQEIQEERLEESAEYSAPVVSGSFLLGNSSTEPSPRVQKPVQEDDKQRVGDGARSTRNAKLEGNQTTQVEWSYPQMTNSRFEPADFRLPNPRGFDSSRLSPRHQYPPRASSHRSLGPSSGTPPVTNRTVGPTSSIGFRPQNLSAQFPAPPRMRTGSPSCSVRPMPERMELGGVRHKFMAPAVRIRSVVPVCSAPPPRKKPGSSQEGTSSNMEKKDKDQDNMSKASSELGKLQI